MIGLDVNSLAEKYGVDDAVLVSKFQSLVVATNQLLSQLLLPKAKNLFTVDNLNLVVVKEISSLAEENKDILIGDFSEDLKKQIDLTITGPVLAGLGENIESLANEMEENSYPLNESKLPENIKTLLSFTDKLNENLIFFSDASLSTEKLDGFRDRFLIPENYIFLVRSINIDAAITKKLLDFNIEFLTGAKHMIELFVKGSLFLSTKYNGRLYTEEEQKKMEEVREELAQIKN